MSDSAQPRGGGTVTVVTFTVEMLLYTAVLTGTCWFAANYFSVLRIPALVFIFVDPVSLMMIVHVMVMLLIFSVRQKSANDAFSDCVLCDISQGFTVVCSVLWLLVLLCMFVDVPRVAAVPGFPSTASVIALGVVLGFSSVIPLLSVVVTYAGVPTGAQNSLMFNGAAVGAFSLLFFVVVSIGSGGVLKCAPYESSGSSFIFYIFVLTYWVLLYLVEVVSFFRWNPLEVMWDSLTGGHGSQEDNGGVKFLSISFWRLSGCILNMVIVATTLVYSKPAIQGIVGVVAVAVGLVHVPLIFVINVDYWLIQTDLVQPDGVEIAEVSNQDTLHYTVPTHADSYDTSYANVLPWNANTNPGFVQTFPAQKPYIAPPPITNDTTHNHVFPNAQVRLRKVGQ